MADPFPVYQKLRDGHPAYYNRDLDLWVLSRYQDVSAAVNDVETYSSAKPGSELPATPKDNVHPRGIDLIC